MEDNSLRFCVKTPEGDITVIIPCEGVHNVYNSLAASSVGLCMGVPLSDIVAGLAEFTGVPMRQQTYSRDGLNIIEDCYNASPTSMESSLSIMYQVHQELGNSPPAFLYFPSFFFTFPSFSPVSRNSVLSS